MDFKNVTSGKSCLSDFETLVGLKFTLQMVSKIRVGTDAKKC